MRDPFSPVHILDLLENLDGAHNRGHKQADLIIRDFAKTLIRCHTDDDWSIMVSVIISSSVDLCLALWTNTKGWSPWS